MDKHSLSHASWECTCHVVRVAKHGRKVPCGQTRREVGETLRTLAGHMDGVEIVEGTACPDHTRICPGIAPKHSGATWWASLRARAR